MFKRNRKYQTIEEVGGLYAYHAKELEKLTGIKAERILALRKEASAAEREALSLYRFTNDR